MTNIYYALIFLCLYGCSSGIKHTTRVENRELTVGVPYVIDTIHAKYQGDTVYAERIVKGDTIVRILYIPKTKLISYKIKPDSIKVKIIDTIEVFTGYTSNDMQAEKFAGFKWGAGIVIIAGVGLYFAVKKLF